MPLTRRHLLATALGVMGGLPFSAALRAATGDELAQDRRNFRFVYGDAAVRAEFRDFLVNVFHLFPEDELHALIAAQTRRSTQDRETYLAVQASLSAIAPFLADLRYAVPALCKQKSVITAQTTSLLGTAREFSGYLEFGSGGRYLDALEEVLDIDDARFVVADRAPSRSPVDIVDRGQLRPAGTYIPLRDYRTDLGAQIPRNSLELVTMYIGFHHCPMALREDFFASIREVMKPGASLIVRDHDAHDEKMLRIVGLAHDVFNLGTSERWEYNERELRNFYALDTLDGMLQKAGFRTDGRRLFQDGDPTLNALMLYRKV